MYMKVFMATKMVMIYTIVERKLVVGFHKNFTCNTSIVWRNIHTYQTASDRMYQFICRFSLRLIFFLHICFIAYVSCQSQQQSIDFYAFLFL